MAGHGRQVDLDGEVQAWSRTGQVFEEETGSGEPARELDRLADADRVAAARPGRSRTAATRATPLDAGQNAPRGEVAALDIAAGDQVVEGRVDRVEVVDQRLAAAWAS